MVKMNRASGFKDTMPVTKLSGFPIEIDYNEKTEIRYHFQDGAFLRINDGSWDRLSLFQWASIREYARSNIAGIDGGRVIEFTLTFEPSCAVTIDKHCYLSLIKRRDRNWRIVSHCIATFALGLSALGVAALCSL